VKHYVTVTLSITVERDGPPPRSTELTDACAQDEATAIRDHLLDTWNDDGSIVAIVGYRGPGYKHPTSLYRRDGSGS
jgi:hypothetical protein